MIAEDKRNELEALSKPLVKWLNDNCNPHTEIRIDSTRAELLEGVCSFQIPEFIKD